MFFHSFSTKKLNLSVLRYCECYAAGIHCEGCNCTNCQNNVENEAVRQEAVEATLGRNPNAFKPKIDSSPLRLRDHGVRNLILCSLRLFLMPCGC